MILLNNDRHCLLPLTLVYIKDKYTCSHLSNPEMALYMLLFTFATILFLTDARPSYKTSSEMENYNDKTDDEDNGVFYERRPRTLNRLPDFVFWKSYQRIFRQ